MILIRVISGHKCKYCTRNFVKWINMCIIIYTKHLVKINNKINLKCDKLLTVKPSVTVSR